MKNFPHFIDWMTMMERIADKKYVLENYTNRITCKGLDSLLSRVPVPRKQKNGAYKRDRRRPFTPESQLQLMSLLFEKPFDLSTTYYTFFGCESILN